jgi:hypothetical protein
MEATIVKLGGGQGNDLQVVGFDEAFGEYSSARGRGRARRKKRKLERIKNRSEVRSARRKARIEGRREAQQARLEKRRAAMEARQEKRTARKDYRVKRKAMGQDVEGEMDEQTAIENGEQGYSPEQGGGGYQEEQGGGGYQEEQGGGGYQEEQGGGGYQDSGEDWNTPPQGFDQSDEGGYDEGGYDEGGSDEGGSDEGGYDDGGESYGGGAEDETGFDGVMGAEDRFSEFQDGLTVSPEAKNLADKLEWNKELYARLSRRKAILQNHSQSTSKIDKHLFQVKNRIAELDAKLTKYANCEGEYSNAEGRPANAEIAKRRRMVGKARKFAKRQRMQMHKQMRVNGGDATQVQSDLKPQFGNQRIVVPAASNATGLNGVDLQDDFDAPDARYIELKSNASGDKKSINWVAIGIGTVVAVGAIWAIRKYKVLG